MKESKYLKIKRSFIVGLTIYLALFVNACATFKKPDTINEASVQDRAQTEESNGIRVSAALVGDEEARHIFGIDLPKKNIQALWIAIENNTDRRLILLPTAIDPEYYAPLEVAFAYHKTFAADANAALDETSEVEFSDPKPHPAGFAGVRVHLHKLVGAGKGRRYRPGGR